jgi:hypothetical protein
LTAIANQIKMKIKQKQVKGSPSHLLTSNNPHLNGFA